MPYEAPKSDAQLWVDLKREYPDHRDMPGRPVADIAPEHSEPNRLPCFTCKQRPAGTPGYYEHSAYCSRCQLEMLNRLPQDKPAGCSRAWWNRLLARCRSELESAVSAVPEMPVDGFQTGIAADYSTSEGNHLGQRVKPVLAGPEGRAG